jgi:hypothetical protein
MKRNDAAAADPVTVRREAPAGILLAPTAGAREDKRTDPGEVTTC